MRTPDFFCRLLCKAVFVIVFLFPGSIVAQSRLDSLKTVFRQESNDSLKIVYELELVREIHRREHNEEEEYQYARDAIERALNLSDTLLYARALDNLGLLYRYHQRYDESIPFHTKAFELVEDKDVDPVQKMIFANNAGVAGRYNHNYDLAVSYYMRALKIAEREDDLKNIAIASNGIGNALGNIPGREEKALLYFERSLAAEKERNNSLGMAMNYLSISDYYIEKGEFGTGREYLNELLEINNARNDQYGLAITNEFFGKAYLKENEDLEKATSHYRNALKGFEELGDKHRQAGILVSLGDIQLEQNNFEEAAEYYQNSLSLATNLDLHGLIMQNSLRLADILEQQNNPSEALYYLKQGNAYEDSIKLSEQNVQIAALIQQYDIEKKESEIELLQKERALQQTLLDNQEQKLERRRILMVLLSLGILFILIILLLQYRHWKTKKEKDARIQEEEKEKIKAIYERNLARAEILVTRLRINPHFLFNSLNAITYLIQSEQNSKAMKYLVVFSRYTRMVLETSQKHVVPLAEELQLTRYYLALEENRFENDFTYEIIGGDAPGVEDALIPPLLLQPFIENAIWHGLLPSKCKRKVLTLEVIDRDESIQIIIDDNGVGRTGNGSQSKKEGHKSMGMQIIRERIQLYNKSYSAKINYEIIDKKDEEGQPQGTRIVFDLMKQGSVEAMQQVS